MEKQQSVVGILSLPLGIIGLLLSCVGIGGFIGFIALILAIIGLTRRNCKKGCAIGGLTVSIISIFIALVVIFAISNRDTTTKTNSNVINTENNNSEDGEAETEDISAFNIEETEIYNKKDIIVKTTGNKTTGKDVEIGFYVENNSKHDINISLSGMAVNNLCYEDNWVYEEVMEGNKTNFTVEVDSSWIKYNNISSIKKIDLLFLASSDDGDLEFKISSTINTDKDDGKYQEVTGKSIYSDENLEIFYLNVDGNDYNFAIYSKYKSFLEYRADQCSINSYTYDGYTVFDNPLLPETYSFFTISVEDDFCEKNNIDEIETIEFKLSADSDAYTTRLTGDGDVSTKKITLNLE